GRSGWLLKRSGLGAKVRRTTTWRRCFTDVSTHFFSRGEMGDSPDRRNRRNGRSFVAADGSPRSCRVAPTRPPTFHNPSIFARTLLRRRPTPGPAGSKNDLARRRPPHGARSVH